MIDEVEHVLIYWSLLKNSIFTITIDTEYYFRRVNSRFSTRTCQYKHTQYHSYLHELPKYKDYESINKKLRKSKKS